MIYLFILLINDIYLFILLIRYLAVMTYDLFIYSINQIFSSNDL